MISVTEAQTRICAAFSSTPTEWVTIDDAAGRALAEEVHARRSHPPQAVSAMDGYAVRSSDLTDPDGVLTVMRWIAAGDPAGAPIAAGECARIFTGAPLPPDADAVVIQEDVAADNGGAVGERVRFKVAATENGNVRPLGLDFKTGERLLAAGRLATSRSVALAASAGHARLAVRRKPRIAVLATGDEIALPGDPADELQIVSSNSVTLKALIRRFGGEPIDLGVARDDPESLRASVAAAAGCDLLVTSGGASVGARDHVGGLLEGPKANLDFWKIAMRPGKPLLFGHTGAAALLGLPGNPVSVFVCATLFLQPAIRTMLGLTPYAPALESAPLAGPRPAGGPRETYFRASGAFDAELGAYAVTPDNRQDSAQFRALADADVLIRTMPRAPAAERGERVEILRLNFD